MGKAIFIHLFSYLILSVARATCLSLPSLAPDSLAPLMPQEPLNCPQLFFENPIAEDRPYCQCIRQTRPVDQAVASLVVSRNEFDLLQDLIEDETVEGFKQELESTLNNTLIFDAYLKRHSMDARLLGNMAECRLGGILNSLVSAHNQKGTPGCHKPTFYKRLAKIFPNQTEAQIREAFATPQSQQQFMNERRREMIERYAPVIHNQKLNPPADACIPFKSSLMISMPPADQRQLMQLLLYQGANEDLAGKRAMAANMLNLPALSRDLPPELVPLGENYQDNSNIQHSVDVINNDPLFLLAFQDKDLRQKLHQHRQSIDECEDSQRTQYEAAVGPQRTARATELQAQFASACNGLQAAALRTCQSKIRRRAIDQAEKESVSRLAWAASNNQPRCPTIADFFSQQQNINDLIKSQNQRCYETKKNDLPGFLCTPALPALTPEQLAFKMAPKIYEHFGATHAPRLISAYLNQHFCPAAASDGDAVSADDEGDDDAPIGAVSEAKAKPYSTLLDPGRPVSDLTRWRQGGDAMENSQYARLNRALCPKLRGTRASGEAYSCAQSPTPAECSSPAQLKAMACRSLDEELATKSITLSAPERLAIHRYPTDDQSLNRVANYSVTNIGGQVASEVLELQRFANSLPGDDPGATCEVAGSATGGVASAAESVPWLESDSAIAAGAGSGSGAGTNAVFSDYFLAAESSDEESLRTFASANPSIASGNPDAGVPTTPYTRRLTPAPPSSTGESLVAPVVAPPVAAVPATATEDVGATTPVAAPLASSGSIEQRVPPLIAALAEDIVPDVPITAPVVNERERHETPLRRDSPDERQALQTELDEYQRTLREYDRELKRMEREERERLREGERIVGPGPSPIVPKRKNPLPADDDRPEVLPGGDGGDNSGNNGDGNSAAVDGNGGSADSSTTSLSDKGDVVDEKQGDKTVAGGGKATRAPASVGGAGVAALAANLSAKGRGLLAQFQEAPIEESLDKQFGIPGIRDADDHYSFESTLVIPHALMKYGVAQVVRALELEAMNFAVLSRDASDPKHQRLKIIVYSWNPENLSWEELSTRAQIAQRIRLKRFADELRMLKMHDDLDDIAQGARASHHHTLKEAHETRAARHNLLTPARHEQVLRALRQR